jgi:hypothetical protein
MEAEDLIIKVEKSLEVKFSNEELEGLVNLSDLEKLAKKKIAFNFENKGKCLSSYVFYKLKKNLPQGIDLNPNQKLYTLFSNRNRIKEYKNLAKNLGYEFPRLTVNSVLVIIFLVSLVFTLTTPFVQERITVLSICSFIILVVSCFLMRVMSRGINKHQTVRDFVNVILATNYMKISREAGSYNMNDISKLIVTIVAYEADCSPSDIKMEFSYKELEMM